MDKSRDFEKFLKSKKVESKYYSKSLQHFEDGPHFIGDIFTKLLKERINKKFDENYLL